MSTLDPKENATLSGDASPRTSMRLRSIANILWSATALVCSIGALVAALDGNIQSSAVLIACVALSIAVAGLFRQ